MQSMMLSTMKRYGWILPQIVRRYLVWDEQREQGGEHEKQSNPPLLYEIYLEPLRKMTGSNTGQETSHWQGIRRLSGQPKYHANANVQWMSCSDQISQIPYVSSDEISVVYNI